MVGFQPAILPISGRMLYPLGHQPSPPFTPKQASQKTHLPCCLSMHYPIISLTGSFPCGKSATTIKLRYAQSSLISAQILIWSHMLLCSKAIHDQHITKWQEQYIVINGTQPPTLYISLQKIFVILTIALSSELQPMDMNSCIATTILIKA